MLLGFELVLFLVELLLLEVEVEGRLEVTVLMAGSSLGCVGSKLTQFNPSQPSSPVKKILQK
ncbi:MAG: hypothetical protein KIS61_13750 [Candidatus Eremiobacteraeota bacterium]|nr:hypothetical protein [Candidatus Eremiobacteraeota bacterium]